MTPYNALKTLGLFAEEIKAEAGIDADGKPIASTGPKKFGRELTPEEAQRIFDE